MSFQERTRQRNFTVRRLRCMQGMNSVLVKSKQGRDAINSVLEMEIDCIKADQALDKSAVDKRRKVDPNYDKPKT